ncbi:MAG: hypothetical protein ACP5M9_03645 [Candidatus Micrarchaeia archaeon]
MALERIYSNQQSEERSEIIKILNGIPSKAVLFNLISKYKDAPSFILSREDLSKKIFDFGTGKTYAHELVKLSLSSSLRAMNSPNIWAIKDKSGWSVGHEAAISHIEVAKECIKNQNSSELLSIQDVKGYTVANAILNKYKNILNNEELVFIRIFIESNKNNVENKTGQNIGSSQKNADNINVQSDTPIKTSTTENKVSNTPVGAQELIDLEEHLKDQIRDDENKNFYYDEKKEIYDQIASMVKKGQIIKLQQLLKDDNLLTNYMVSNNIGLDIVLNHKGHTVGHLLAASNESLAIKLISNLKTAEIATKDKNWSIAHEAVLHYKNAAHVAMNSENIWDISENNGKSVGHVAVRTHKDIAMLCLGHENSKRLLLVEDDNMMTVAHAGLYWSEFSLMVLEDKELYSIKDYSGRTLALIAVTMHASSARKVLRVPERYISVLGQKDGSQLIRAAKQKLAEQK